MLADEQLPMPWQAPGLAGAVTANPLMQRQIANQRAMRPAMSPFDAWTANARAWWDKFDIMKSQIVSGVVGGVKAPYEAWQGNPLVDGVPLYDTKNWEGMQAQKAMETAGLAMTGGFALGRVPEGALGMNAPKMVRMLDNDITPLLEQAKKSQSLDEFRRSTTQGHLTDLSNQEMHRYGRAIPPYKGEPYTDIPEILANGSNPGSYLTTIKYERPEIYRHITSPKETITAYRAVPKDAGDRIRVGDYVALEERYARMHGESVLGAQQGVKWKLVKEEIPKKDIVWGNADFAEWAYSPKAIREQYPSLEDLYTSVKKP